MLTWKKLGNVFDPSVLRPRPWMQQYAQCPSPFRLDERTVRVFITSRGAVGDDAQYVSYPSYVDLAADDLSRIVAIAQEPVLALGSPGSFDEFGITTSSIVPNDGAVFAYYTGWTRLQSVPYSMSIGVARSRDGGRTFGKLGAGPILGPALNEPYFVSGPAVHIIDGRWHMWYLTGLTWLIDAGKYEPVYQLAHAESRDGITWERDGLSVIAPKAANECQVSFALFSRWGRWHTIFAYRQATGFRTDSGRMYRLGYAVSDDLRTWTRDDPSVGIDVSESGWDSQMLCYPQVGQVDDRLFLFYCGNEFGRNGFGIAELIDR